MSVWNYATEHSDAVMRDFLGTISDVAPILWQYGALARLKKGETIDKLLYNGYSTISLGYAGLYEMCMRMLGKTHTDPEAQTICNGSYAEVE